MNKVSLFHNLSLAYNNVSMLYLTLYSYPMVMKWNFSFVGGVRPFCVYVTRLLYVTSLKLFFFFSYNRISVFIPKLSRGFIYILFLLFPPDIIYLKLPFIYFQKYNLNKISFSDLVYHYCAYHSQFIQCFIFFSSFYDLIAEVFHFSLYILCST